MARVRFELERRFASPPRRVWAELVDWPGHGAWIPMTTVDAGDGDPTEVGYTFTAWSGLRPLALEDRMRVVRCEWDDTGRSGICEVAKLGPVLGGHAGFTVRPDGAGTVLAWREDVTIDRLPRFLSPIAARLGVLGFTLALRSLDRLLTRGRDHGHVEARITCGSDDEARRIADALVERRLAACVHTTPIASVYEWEGAVQHDDEIALTAVTRADRFDDIVELVGELHSYDLPSITSVPMHGATGYLGWVDRMVDAGD